MRISPISFTPFKSTTVLQKEAQKPAAPADVSEKPRDIANFTREVKMGEDGTKTTTDRTKNGIVKRIETQMPNGAGTFEDYAEDGKTIYRCGVFTGKGHQVITMYYPDGETLQSMAEINPDGTALSKGYSLDGKLIRLEKVMKNGRTVIVEFPSSGTKKVTQIYKGNISTATYFDKYNSPKYEFDMVRGKLMRARFYESSGEYTETKFLEGGAFETIFRNKFGKTMLAENKFLEDGAFGIAQGRAEKVQIAGTTVYNHADGTNSFVTRNPDGSITLEPCDSDGLPLDA